LIKSVLKKLIDLAAVKTKEKKVIVMSDDWGSVRIRSKKDQQSLIDKGLRIANRFDQFDALETNEDLELLFDVLTQHKDKNGNHPVITAVTNVANPDFHRIQENSFEHYYYKTVDHCYRDTPDSDRVLGLVQQGIDQRIFIPQSHGREHLQINWWMKELQNPNSFARHVFDHEFFFIPGSKMSNNYRNRGVGAAFDVWDQEDLDSHKVTLKSSLKKFEKVFGYKSVSFTPPAMFYHSSLETQMYSHGVKWLDVGRFFKTPRVGGGERWQLNYLGRRKKSGLQVLVRNAVFEPNLHGVSGSVDHCMKRIDTAFKHRQPAIISNHRAAFVGGIDDNNRSQGLKALNHLLTKILKAWPDVEFLSMPEFSKSID